MKKKGKKGHLKISFIEADHGGKSQKKVRLLLIVYCCLQVIAADGEQKAAKALRDAAEVISQSGSALQLRYLQVNTRSGIKRKTLIFGGGNFLLICPFFYLFSK